MVEFGDFHSAVNRIPMPREKAAGLADHGVLSKDLFKDRASRGHDRLEPDRWSGSIDLEMTVRTPLVFGEQGTKEIVLPGGRKDKHTFVDLPQNGDGTVCVPPTMVKGMISRAYETLTCSRFRVFNDLPDEANSKPGREADTSPLTYRGDAASALGLVPVRITGWEGNQLIGKLMYGDVDDYWNYRGHDYPMVKPARLRTASIVQTDVSQDDFNSLTAHGNRIVFHATLCLHGDKPRRDGRPDNNKYCYWQVTHIQHRGRMCEVFRIPRNVTQVDTLERMVGYVCRTAPRNSPSELFHRKHDEHVFFDASKSGPILTRIGIPVQDAYRTVIESYMQQRDNDPRNKRKTPNRATAAVQRARQRKEDTVSAASLSVGTLAFAVVDESNDVPIVREVVPTMIGRHAYRKSPFRLAQTQGVAPLSMAEEASAADRLFGYVVPDPGQNAAGGDVATRGRIAVGKVDGSGARISRDRKTLTPLLEPKPGSARRFLTGGDGGTPSSKGSTNALKRSEYFSPGQLLGAAAYPVHRSVLDSRKFPKQATASAVMNGREQHNADVQLTAKSWVEVGSVLRCTVSFTNLSHDELAALIWVLTPENLVPESEQDSDRSKCGYLRMGLAKPFGLGVMEVRIARGGLRARRGADLSDSYATLSGCLGLDDPVAEPSDFTLSHSSNLNKTPWVEAMQRAAYGYADGIEVRHMTLNENKENNQTNGRTGEPHPGKGIGPRDMFGPHSAKPLRVDKRPQSHGRPPYPGSNRHLRP